MARTFRVFLTPEEDGEYSVSIPSLPGCHSQGDSIEDALNLVKEAISLHLEGLEADEELIPDDSKMLEYSLKCHSSAKPAWRSDIHLQYL